MTDGSTLLTYESGWQKDLFHLMTNSEQLGRLGMACNYGIALLKLLKIPEEKHPKLEMSKTKKREDQIQSWENYYTSILFMVTDQIGQTIEDVRNAYREKGDIPSIVKEGK